MSSTFISRFTPSLMTPETLEALFIQRGKLAEQVLGDIRHSAVSKAKHYLLLIGQRGLGKTHFVALIYNRLKNDAALMKRLRIAWLREDERGISSFLELLMRILHALARDYPDAGLQEKMQALYDQSPKQAERMAQEVLTEFLGKRTLLLLVENLDSIFLGLKEPGQQALRAYLQEKGNCTILATSTALFNGVSLQRSPFYGFFNIHHLQELTLEEAIELLAHIAEARQDQELADFIRTPTGRARIRAIHHLAGGNHRIYVVFSEFLTRESLDELVTPFMRMLDDLTPYYQGRMDLLSPQQQQIVEYLAHAGGAQTVKAIARPCFVTPQIAAVQLRTLKERGFLQTHTPRMDKRETYYELREPLMRLCFEVKEYRGGPIRLFVDFLRNWYSREELQLHMASLPETAIFTRECLQEALAQLEQDKKDPRIIYCLKYLDEYNKQDDWSHLTQVAEELTSIRGEASDWLYYACCLMHLNANEEIALNAFNIAVEKNIDDNESWYLHAIALRHFNHLAEALVSINRSLVINSSYVPAIIEKIALLEQLDRIDEYVEFTLHTIIHNPIAVKQIINQQDAFATKISSLSTLITKLPYNSSTLTLVLTAKQLVRKNQFDEAIERFRELIEEGDDRLRYSISRETIRSIQYIKAYDVLPAQRERWLKDWMQIASDREDFESPLAMLAAAVQYLNTDDDRALLELPQEQRKLVLEQLADTPAEEGDTGNTTK